MIARISITILILLSFEFHIQSQAQAQQRSQFCHRYLESYSEPASITNKTHVIADGYRFEYPSNYRVILKNNGNYFITDNRNYQYMQCLVREREGTDLLPQGIEIRWTREELYGSVISRQTIAGRNSIIYGNDDRVHPQVFVAIPSQGGHVVVSADLCGTGICLEEGFRRVLNSLVVP
ncbi:hypothetical protein NG798_24235 [Ancylothrix sp. C2]|uniref:hypothetical protein n=1 Tax=Ancylothrix sp. D3o TaxID=2953691 RepID=UPI0021BB84DF|nr:hypothetical protein [Ancylothrix sp. D3o]MCT7952913.1 hypothetical protein [Ancylothrix sp. D3o]